MTHTVFSMQRGPMLSLSQMINSVIFCKSNQTKIMNKDGLRITQLVLLLIQMSFCRTQIANSSISFHMRNTSILIWIIYETFICSSLIIHSFCDTLKKIVWTNKIEMSTIFKGHSILLVWDYFVVKKFKPIECIENYYFKT